MTSLDSTIIGTYSNNILTVILIILYRDSLVHVLAHYQISHAPAYMGWDTEEEAIAEYNRYEATRDIPFKLHVYRKDILVDSSVVGVNLLPPQCATPILAGAPSGHPETTPQHAILQATTPHHAQSAPAPSPTAATHTPVSLLPSTPTRQHTRPVLHTSSSAAISPMAANRGRLYIVLKGHALGVYNTQ